MGTTDPHYVYTMIVSAEDFASEVVSDTGRAVQESDSWISANADLYKERALQCQKEVAYLSQDMRALRHRISRLMAHLPV